MAQTKDKKKVVTVDLRKFSRERSERMNFRCSPRFKAVMAAIHEKRKEDGRSWYNKYSDADILDDAIHLLAKERGVVLE